MTGHRNMQRKLILLSLLLIVVLLCGAIFFAASNAEGDIVDAASNPDAMLKFNEVKAINNLRQFDKVVDAMVHFETSGSEISAAYIVIHTTDEINDSEMSHLSEDILAYFGDLEDNIHITYLDPSCQILNSDRE